MRTVELSTSNCFHLGARFGVKSVLVAVLVGSALGASVTAASADVVPGTEDGWGTPPGGVTLSVVGDDGSGNHLLTVTWGPIDPIPADGGYWSCDVDERYTPTQLDDQGRSPKFPESTTKANFRVKLDPPSGGSFQQNVVEAPGARIKMSIECRTVYPGAFPVTPGSAPFGWRFEYQLS